MRAPVEAGTPFSAAGLDAELTRPSQQRGFRKAGSLEREPAALYGEKFSDDRSLRRLILHKGSGRDKQQTNATRFPQSSR